MVPVKSQGVVVDKWLALSGGLTSHFGFMTFKKLAEPRRLCARSVVATQLVTCFVLALVGVTAKADPTMPASSSRPSMNQTPISSAKIFRIVPPEKGFFSKSLNYEGIAIKAHAVVEDAALVEARKRLDMMLCHLPEVRQNLVRAGAELHIIGKSQVTSDLPEHREMKGQKIAEYGGLTVDERTRGLGGLLTSCGEENLLKLPQDRYKGRDICVHEFAHNIQDHGVPESVRELIRTRYHASIAKGLWVGAYSASNESEFFAELTMWYFGLHGDMNMTGPKPADGPEGLKAYDPEAYILLDDFYSGRIPVARIQPTP